MSPSRQQVKDLLVSMLPEGSADLYELSNTSGVGGTLWGLAGAVKTALTDRVDALQREVNPSTIVENLPEWEQATGLAYTPIALHGSAEQRRNAVLSALRMPGGFSLDDIRAIVQPHLLYADPSQIEIREPSRAALRVAHTYIQTMSVTAPAATLGTSTVSVVDAPVVSAAGATMSMVIETLRLDRTTFIVTCPDGFQVSYPEGWLADRPTATGGYLFHLYGKAFAGHEVGGDWTLEFYNPIEEFTVYNWDVFVEGIGYVYDGAVPPNRIGEGLGAALFEFQVVADPMQLGAGFDLGGAQRALTRWKPAHTRGSVILGP